MRRSSKWFSKWNTLKKNNFSSTALSPYLPTMKKIGLMLCSFGLLLISCGQTEPSKDAMIQHLNALLAADLSGAENEVDFYLIPGSVEDKEDFLRAVNQPLRDRARFQAGIDELQDEGVFGPLLTVFPSEGLKWMQRYGIDDATSCYGLRYKHVQLAGLWQKGTFKFFRLEYGRRKV